MNISLIYYECKIRQSNSLSFFFFYLDVAQSQINGAPNETQTHSCRFTSLACYHYSARGAHINFDVYD